MLYPRSPSETCIVRVCLFQLDLISDSRVPTHLMRKMLQFMCKILRSNHDAFWLWVSAGEITVVWPGVGAFECISVFFGRVFSFFFTWQPLVVVNLGNITVLRFFPWHLCAFFVRMSYLFWRVSVVLFYCVVWVLYFGSTTLFLIHVHPLISLFRL